MRKARVHSEEKKKRNEFVEAKDAQHGKIFMARIHLVCLWGLGNQNIGTPEMHGKRMPLTATEIGRQPTDIQVDSSMDEND
ncbi:hypothetical protein V6N13_125329 [Hibiscus sabdariffa]|uniref:Uncharacterized protein n=1 Tax=Hibiscus sabdariffa TaxID=183260 RepID=A0ABR2U5L6_9ROSI